MYNVYVYMYIYLSIYLYIYLNHFAIHLKLAYYYKLYFNKKFKKEKVIVFVCLFRAGHWDRHYIWNFSYILYSYDPLELFIAETQLVAWALVSESQVLFPWQQQYPVSVCTLWTEDICSHVHNMFLLPPLCEVTSAVFDSLQPYGL